MEVLSKIWKLADVNQDNYLSSDEFCVAFHLIVLVSRRGVALPTVRKVYTERHLLVLNHSLLY